MTRARPRPLHLERLALYGLSLSLRQILKCVLRVVSLEALGVSAAVASDPGLRLGSRHDRKTSD